MHLWQEDVYPRETCAEKPTHQDVQGPGAGSGSQWAPGGSEPDSAPWRVCSSPPHPSAPFSALFYVLCFIPDPLQFLLP